MQHGSIGIGDGRDGFGSKGGMNVSQTLISVTTSLLCKMHLFDADGHLIPDTVCNDHGFIREGKWVVV